MISIENMATVVSVKSKQWLDFKEEKNADKIIKRNLKKKMDETHLSQDGYVNWIQNNQKRTETITCGWFHNVKKLMGI